MLKKSSQIVKPSAEAVLQELQKRRVDQFRLEEFLFKKQLEFVQDKSPFKTAVTSRRAGKTVSCAADLIYTALSQPEVVCLYVTLARTVAKRNIWPEIKRINRRFKLGFEFNESELSATAPNDSIIYLSGASDKTEIEKFRGLAIKKVYLDECQSFASYIEELIDEVLAPALMDYSGSLILIGTPGPVPNGYFYECSKSKNWTHHFWTFFDNPYIPLKSGRTHEQMLQRELDRTGLPVNSPKIQREWFGQWVLDENSLVYQYNSAISSFDRLPPGPYTCLLGIDVGFHDADALAVLAWSPEHRMTYLVEELVIPRQGISELVDQIRVLRSKYEISKMIMDTGGLGKKIAEELSRRYQLAVEPADKSRKVEYIELFNDDLRSGRFKAKPTGPFAQDCMKVEWDFDKSRPDKKVISDRYHSDICDAVLYAWRYSYSYTHVPKNPAPRWGTDAWREQELERMEREAEEYFKNLEEMNKDPFSNDF